MSQPQGQQPRDRAVAFSRPEQVQEILLEADRLKLQVLIKYSNDGKTIRGFVEHFDLDDKSIRIGGISQAGDSLLKGYDFVKVEFILLSKKLIFVSKVRARTVGKMVLALPDKLVAVERRSGQRFRVPPSHGGFVEFIEKQVDLGRMDAPFLPAFMGGGGLAIARLRIDDVSLGGVAGFTRYPAIAEQLRSGEESLSAILYFPRMAPIPTPISVRWTKKTLSALPPSDHADFQKVVSQRIRSQMGGEPLQLKESYYRIGLQFAEVSKELDTALRTFIRLVQASDSI